MKLMDKITLALDWTPNINHIGFFVAKDKNFYENYDLKIYIEDPSIDNYQLTPAKKLENRQVDFALCPLESIISFRTKSNPINFKAVAKLFDNDLSAIATNNKSIKSPKYLDGKSYASYNARYEDKIIIEMTKNDGGIGNIDFVYPDKLGIWNTLVNEKYDSTWIFLNWEGIQAESNNLKLNYFKMEDYKIPYSYSPVISAREDCIESKFSIYKKFLAATKEGYIYSKNNIDESVSILSKYVPKNDKDIDLKKSLLFTAENFHNSNWGLIEQKKVKVFVEWLRKMNLIDEKINHSLIFTNSLL